MLATLVVDRVEGDGVTSRPVPLAPADARASSFRRLVDQDLDHAYRLAAVILGDRFDAEDAVQDAVMTRGREVHVAYSVLGLSVVGAVQLPVVVAEPARPGCSGG